MKKIYLTFLALLVIKSFSIAQNYSRRWANVYIDSSTDYHNLNDMAVDGKGNSYLSGYEVDEGDEYYQTHFVLFKVNANGTFGWKRNFNNLKDSIDEAIAVATDTAGNVYVTGRRMDTFCNICTYNTTISDIITVKYNASGQRVWLNRYHDSVYKLAAPTDISIATNGNILITGNERHYVSEIGTYVNSLVVQKIDKNGKTLWVKKVNDVTGNAGSFDKKNNIVIAGASGQLFQTQKPIVLKFNGAGTFLWSNTFNEYNKNGRLYYVGCDSLNNIYVNGQTDTLTFFNVPRIVTIKYNSTGQQQWFKKEVNRTYTLPHFYGDFKVDASGNSYLAGYVNKSAVDDDFVITKYGPGGAKKWSVTYNDSINASDKPVGLALDKNGNTWVSGYMYNGTFSIITVGYNKAGSQIFSDVYKRKNANGVTTGIGVDKNNNVYTGGNLGISIYPGSVVIKYGIKNPVSIAEENSVKLNELSLYPNPAVNTLNLSFTATLGIRKYSLIIHDISGNPVLTKQISNNDLQSINLNIDLGGLKRGVYKASITDGVNLVSKTFIKE